jgi:hypothetical protein
MYVKYRYSSHILMKIEFSRQSFKNYTNVKFHKIRLVGIELFYADRQT